MLRRTIIALAAITIFTSITLATPPKTGCKKFNFVGTFLSGSHTEVFNGSGVFHEHAFQLTLHADGTVNQYWSGLPDYQINLGTGTPQIGSWTCRDDGKLVIVMIQATYLPSTIVQEPVPNTSPDVALTGHSRTTYLFSVDDDNTLSRIQSRTRFYEPNEDPTIATGGTLLPLSSLTRTYRRLIASDADLAP